MKNSNSVCLLIIVMMPFWLNAQNSDSLSTDKESLHKWVIRTNMGVKRQNSYFIENTADFANDPDDYIFYQLVTFGISLDYAIKDNWYIGVGLIRSGVTYVASTGSAARHKNVFYANIPIYLTYQYLTENGWGVSFQSGVHLAAGFSSSGGGFGQFEGGGYVYPVEFRVNKGFNPGAFGGVLLERRLSSKLWLSFNYHYRFGFTKLLEGEVYQVKDGEVIALVSEMNNRGTGHYATLGLNWRF